MRKSRFDKIKDVITKGNENGLVTKIGKRRITLSDKKELVEGISSGKIGEDKARKMYCNIANDANSLKKLNATETRKKMIPIFKQLEEIFKKLKRDNKTGDEADDKTGDEACDKTDDNKQPDTTDMPDLEFEESAEQRIQGLKKLTSNQMSSRLPISLARLKTENNSEKLKNEIRQLLYSLNCSMKLSKTIYNGLINFIEKWKQYL